MTAADLAALERLLAEATPGEWCVDESLGYVIPFAPKDNTDFVADCLHREDMRLIVAMHAALPELIAAARERDGLRARMESNENAWNAEQGELLDLVADRTIDLAGAKTAARFIAAERDALRAEVERMRAVVEAAREIDSACDRDEPRYVPCRASSGSGALCRACRVDVALAAALAALDGKDSAK